MGGDIQVTEGCISPPHREKKIDANLNLDQEALNLKLMEQNYLWGLCPYCGWYLLERYIDDPINDVFGCRECGGEIWMGDQDYPDEDQEKEVGT